MTHHENSLPSGFTVALIAPDERRRNTLKDAIVATSCAVREFGDYPEGNAVSRLLEGSCDIIVVDLDDSMGRALGFIEKISRQDPTITIVACSCRNEADAVIRAMRAGAREFLSDPLTPAMIVDAFSRSALRRHADGLARAAGKTLVFQGAKGGTGVTTLATNFAVALAKNSNSVVLVDLHPQLGEVALSLGIAPRFSLPDALSHASRLDGEFLSTLLTKHDSGLAVLASAEQHGAGASRSVERGSEKLFRVLREEFSFVVVDAGPCTGHTPDSLFEIADSIFCVVENSLPALRNARRMISYLGDKGWGSHLQLILNRCDSRVVEIDGESASQALGRSPEWKIPNDYMGVRGAQNLGVPLMNRDSPLSRAIRDMARAVSGNSGVAEAHKGAAAAKGEKWKFWTSNTIRPLSTVRS